MLVCLHIVLHKINKKVRKTQHIIATSICLYTFIYLLLINSAKHFSNLMNLGEIYIFLFQQLELGKRFLQPLTHF